MKINNKLILGTANFLHPYGILGNKIPKNKIKNILNYSKKKKIKYLEISKDYKNSQYFTEFSKYFKIYNKIDLTSSFIKSISENDLIRYLKIDENNKNISYAVTLRKPNILFKKGGKKFFKILNKFRLEGKIKKIGISIYKTKNLKNIIKNFKIDYIQLPLNIVNKEVFISSKKIIRKRKIEIHARSIFLQGLLLKKNNNLPKNIIKLKDDWSFIDKSLNKIKVSRFSACINYVLNFKIDKILIGINDLKQLDEILKFKRISKKIPFFSIKKKNLIDPIYWLKFKKNENFRSKH